MKFDLTPFEKALSSLEEVLAIPVDPIIRDSTIQRFEYTYELAIKMLKRFLKQSATNAAEIDGQTFKDIIRLAAEQGLVEKPEDWFVYRQAQNQTSHGYDEKKAVVVYENIGPFAKSAQKLLKKLKQLSPNL